MPPGRHVSSSPALSNTAAAPAARDECRCLCGSLLARLVEGGVELKCRRCKRTVLVPLPDGAGGGFRPVAVRGAG